MLDSGSLPLGILDSLRPDTASYDLEENDTLLFISDGISQAFGSTTDLYNVLKGIPTGNPQQLADVLLQAAIDAYVADNEDNSKDVTVRIDEDDEYLGDEYLSVETFKVLSSPVVIKKVEVKKF